MFKQVTSLDTHTLRLLAIALGAVIIPLFGLDETRAQEEKPTPAGTVAPVVIDPSWQPSHLQYPVGWDRGDIARVSNIDRIIRCAQDLGIEPVERSWREMNCQVRRVVEGVVAAAVGVALVTTAWGGFSLMLESQNERMRGQTKMLIMATALALCVAMLAYAFASMLDNGLIPHTPWATETFRR